MTLSPRHPVIPSLRHLVILSPCHLVALLLLVCAPTAPAQAPRLTPDELTAREAKAGQDPVQVLLLVPLAEANSASRLRQRVAQLLEGNKRSATAAELDAVAGRVARVLPACLRTPAEVRETLGPPCRVSRQVLHNRYLEQWLYDSPLSLCVVLECRKGQDPNVQTVLPIRDRQN
jgi:hypothetical protein